MANSRLPNRLGARALLLLSRVRLQVSAGGDDRASRNRIWHHRHRRQRDSWNLLLHLLNHQPYRRRCAGPRRREEGCARRHFHFGDRLPAFQRANRDSRIRREAAAGRGFSFCLHWRGLSGLARFLRPIEIMRRVDQRDVGEGLGKIAQQPFAGGIILFREQAKIIA